MPLTAGSTLNTKLTSLWAQIRPAFKPILIAYTAFTLVIFLTLGIYILRDRALFVSAYDTHAPWASNENGLYGTYPKPVAVPSYILDIFPIALGYPIYPSSLLGLALVIITRNKAGLVLILSAMPFYIFLERIHYHPVRFGLPLIPLLCLWAAYFFDTLLNYRRVGILAFSTLLLSLALAYSTAYTYAFIKVMDVKRDIRFAAAEWIQAQAKQRSKVAMLAHETTTHSIGFVEYGGLGQFNGERYAWAGGPPDLVVIPKAFSDVLQQYLRLTAAGYNYSASDWYPLAAAPAAETLRLFENVSAERGYKRVKVFKNEAVLPGGKIRFGFKKLRFDYFWLTNLEVSIYQRTVLE